MNVLVKVTRGWATLQRGIQNPETNIQKSNTITVNQITLHARGFFPLEEVHVPRSEATATRRERQEEKNYLFIYFYLLQFNGK